MFNNLNFENIIIILIILFISTALHEIMHAYVALKLGDDLAYLKGRISLNPMSHIDPILTIALPAMLMLLGMQPIFAAKPVPINPNRVSGGENGMALIAAAGPLTNLALAALAAALLRFGMVDGGFLQDFTLQFMLVNVGLFVFNLLPITPLDGSRVLYAFAPEPVQRVMERIESLGIFMIIFFLAILFPLFGDSLSNIQVSIARFLIGG